jgi:hypothetical protein
VAKYNAEQFIRAIEGTGGIIWQIAQNVGCGWHTAKRYIEKHPSVKRAWEAEKNRIVDMAKHNIVGAVEDGDLQLSKWYVTVLDKEFRPAQRHEISGADGQPLEVRFVNDWRGSLTDASPGPTGDTTEPSPVQVAGGGATVAQDDPGDASSS